MANINLQNLQHQLVLAEQRLELADADQKDATAELIKLSKLRSKSRNSVSDAEYRKYSQIQINATEAKHNALEQVRNIRRMIAAAPVSRFQQLVRSRVNPSPAVMTSESLARFQEVLASRRAAANANRASASARRTRSRSSSRSSRSGSRSSRSSRSGSRSSSRNRGSRRNR